MNRVGPDMVVVLRLKLLTRFAALFSACLGSFVLAGWAFDVPMMKTVLPGLASMKPNTAICVASTGLSLWLFTAQEDGKLKRKLTLGSSMTLAFVVFGIALATLFEYLYGWNFHFDELLFKDLVPDGHSLPGRMAPNTAISFAALGYALILLPVESKEGYRPAQFLSLIPALFSLSAIVGYLYSVVSFYRVASYTGMAMHTAVAIFLLSHGIFFQYPNRGVAAVISSQSLGGVVVRRLLPAAFLIPMAIGWVCVEGQKAGFYGAEFGLALMVTLNVVVFSTTIYMSGTHIHQIAVARAESEDSRMELNYTLQALIDAFPCPVVSLDRHARIENWNRAAERVFGWSSLQVRGQLNPLVCDDRREEYDTILEILRRGDPVLGLGTALLSREDEKIPVNLWGAPIVIGTRGIFGFVLIMEDLRERQKLEAKLKQYQTPNTPAMV